MVGFGFGLGHWTWVLGCVGLYILKQITMDWAANFTIRTFIVYFFIETNFIELYLGSLTYVINVIHCLMIIIFFRLNYYYILFY